MRKMRSLPLLGDPLTRRVKVQAGAIAEVYSNPINRCAGEAQNPSSLSGRSQFALPTHMSNRTISARPCFRRDDEWQRLSDAIAESRRRATISEVRKWARSYCANPAGPSRQRRQCPLGWGSRSAHNRPRPRPLPADWHRTNSPEQVLPF